MTPTIVCTVRVQVAFGNRSRAFVAAPRTSGDPVQTARKCVIALANDASLWLSHLQREAEGHTAPTEVTIEMDLGGRRREFSASDIDASISVSKALVDAVRDDALAWLWQGEVAT